MYENNNEKEQNKKNTKRVNLFFSIIVVFILLVLLAPILILCYKFFVNSNTSFAENTVNILVTTLLTTIGINVVLVTLVPYFMNTNIINNALAQKQDEISKLVNNKLEAQDNTNSEKIKASLESEKEKIIELAKEQDIMLKKFDLKTDAHLSRMIAFFLYDKKMYFWAIGWASRSLQRYKFHNQDKKYYDEFTTFTSAIVLDSIRMIIIEINDSNEIKSRIKNIVDDELKERDKIICNVDHFYTDGSRKDTPLMVMKRAIKDMCSTIVLYGEYTEWGNIIPLFKDFIELIYPILVDEFGKSVREDLVKLSIFSKRNNKLVSDKDLQEEYKSLLDSIHDKQSHGISTIFNNIKKKYEL